MEVQAEGAPPLVLDCGTGARALGIELLKRRTPEVHVLFTHFHMDHLFGFPFFGPIYSPNSRVSVAVPAYSGIEAQNKLGRYLSGIYHPLRLNDVAARLHFEGVRPGRPFEIGPYRIEGIRLEHPGGSCGYRIACGDCVILHLTDTAPLARPDRGLTADRPPPAMEQRVLDAMREADLVIMDTMFSWEEYLEKMTWGHAYPEYAHRIAVNSGVRKLVLFHHAPEASDEALDELRDHWATCDDLEVLVSQEGMSVDLEG